MKKRTGPMTCWYCKHFQFKMGTADYSDVTPGDPPELWCEKKHYRYDGLGMRDCPRDLSQEEFRVVITTAETCCDFESF